MRENISKQSSKRDVSVVFDLHRVLRKRSPKAMLFSIFAVALLLIGPLSLVIAGIGESSADDEYGGDLITITYHPYKGNKKPDIDDECNYGKGVTYEKVVVKYYGDFASTEYNPQFWNNKVNEGGSSSLIGVDNVEPWYGIKEHVIYYTWTNIIKKKATLFTGWIDKDGKNYDPGDIIKSEDVTDGEIELYATWGKLENYSDKVPSIVLTTGSAYTNIVEGITVEGVQNGKDIGGNYTMRNCTINVENGFLNIKNGANMVIIDNAEIIGNKGKNPYDDNNHGAGNTGIFANGSKLIIGSNVKSTHNNNSTKYSEADYAQIFGGSKTDNCGPTNLIIHSGTFSNVVSGSQSGIVRDTKVILKDVTILDTLTAGVDSKVDGSTYIYATAINMPGDSYEEGKLGSNDLPGGVTLTESTIITGGCNRAEVTRDTHVFIAGTSKIWDVQGAGRGGGSSVNKSNVTIGGKAVVKHIVAGSITDGMDSGGDKQCVKNTNITVKDQSIVCSVFGAGYDTFYKATYASMYNGGSIAVTIDGDCTVGYVYGGGYRGTIGTKDKPIESISININGGKVLNDVFGGGRGGLDKVCHNADGTFNWGSSHNDTTGFSIVYCNKIKISISEGAIVEGNVYGGGESTPYITKYDGMDIVGKPGEEVELEGFTGNNNISLASVISNDVEINVNGIVHGSVFGAGKGISKKLDENNRHPSAYIFAMKNKESVVKIPWLVKNDNSNVPGTEIKKDSEHFSHDNYASLTSNIKINMGSNVNESTMDVPVVSGSIHGGGAFSKTYGNDKTISIEMTGGIVKESIFGGGKGSSGNINAGSVDVKEISIKLTGGNVLKSVYGGGELAQTKTSSGINVIINGCEVASNVFGGGLGTSNNVSTKSKRKVKLVSGKVIGSIFGSSSLGNDETENETENETEKFDSFVVIEGGEVGGSVYGGGFKGKTHGNTGITITGGTILYSVYGGADVGDVNHENPFFNEKLVTGESTITVSGENTSIGRSIFGSGNSCLVGGQKKVTISNVTLTSTDSIQNVNELKISDSTIHLSGRSDATTSQASTKYSLNNIGRIILEKNVELGLKSPTNDIGEYTSNGGTLSSLSNKLVLYGGLSLSVLRNQHYGLVSGYTILQTDNGKYSGAFAYGSKESTGTFVILKDGNYVESLTRDYSNPECRCWYIAGNVTYVTTIVADGKPIDPKKVDIPIQNPDSDLIYTGFDKKVPVTDRFNLTTSITDDNDFSMSLKGNNVNFGTNGVLRLSDDVASIDGYDGYVMSIRDVLPSATIELTSSTNLGYTGLVATITIHLKEMKKIGDTYFIVNSIDIVVNIYTEATSFPEEEYELTISTKNGKGNADFIINRSYQGYVASVESIKGADAFSNITVESFLNSEGTLGWATPLSGKKDVSSINPGWVIGDLTGSFSATIRFTSNCNVGEIPTSAMEFTIKLSKGNTVKSFKLIVTVVENTTERSVTFINKAESSNDVVRTIISVHDGETILESQKPHTWEYFVGWYSDEGRNNLFDFTSPITGDITIYSLYGYTVHFDDGFGNEWSTYVRILEEGHSTITMPTVSERPSYVFNNWVTNGATYQPNDVVTIESDMTFYAKWTGVMVEVTLTIDGVDKIIKGEVEYGKTYSELKSSAGSNVDFNGIDQVFGKVGLNKKLICWEYVTSISTKEVYSDTVTVSNESHELRARLTDGSTITVKFVYERPSDYMIDKVKPDTIPKGEYWYGYWEDLIKIQAPTEMIVPKNGNNEYTFKPGNASFTGYTLEYWYFIINGTERRIHPTETYTLTDVADDSEIEVKPHWKHIQYEFNIEDPRGGSISAENVTNTHNRFYHGDVVEVEYKNNGSGYRFSKWGQIGSSSFDVITSNPGRLTIEGNVTIYAILGGIYEAKVKLSVNGQPDGDKKIQLKHITTGNTTILTAYKGEDNNFYYVNSQVRFGTYDVQIFCSDESWLDVARYTITGSNSLCEVELYTITTENNNDRIITYPEFSTFGKKITLVISEGYDVEIEKEPSNLDIIDWSFYMPKEPVKLTFTITVKKFNLTFDLGEGSFSGDQSLLLGKTIDYFGNYDTKNIDEGLEREGYVFDGSWDVYVGDVYIKTIKDGYKIAVLKDHTLKAVWNSGDANYTVKIYLMDLNGGYDDDNPYNIINLKGKTGDDVTYEPASMPGFITPGKVEGTINGYSSLVLEVRYVRQKYDVTFKLYYPDDFVDEEITIKEVFFDKKIEDIEYAIKDGFVKSEIKDAEGNLIDTIPASSSGNVTIFVTLSYTEYIIEYFLGDGVFLSDDPPYTYTIKGIKLPEAKLDGHKFIGWGGVSGSDNSNEIPRGCTGDLILIANYSKLPVITVINSNSVKVTGNVTEKPGGGIYVLNDPDDRKITFKYIREGETVYRWFINGEAKEPNNDGSYECSIENDTIVFALPKLRDTGTTSTPLELIRVTLAFTQSANGDYSTSLDNLPYNNFTIEGLSKYGLGEGFSIELTSNNKINISGLKGVTGTLFIKESSRDYNVEIILHIVSVVVDSELGGRSQ